MNAIPPPADRLKSTLSQYLLVLAAAVTWVAVVDLFTNVNRPLYDAEYYILMARDGILNNHRLIAPFAYRPGMPLLARALSAATPVSLADSFQVVGWVSMVALLGFSFALARCFVSGFGAPFLATCVVAFEATHVKFPIFFFTLVDVAAYPLLVAAFWALVRKRYLACLLISSVGILFKEFLAIPLAVLIFELIRVYRRDRSSRALALIAAAVALGVCAVVLPRALIHVSGTQQEIDPLNAPQTLWNLLRNPLDWRREVNILFSIASYWLPVLMLVDGARWRAVMEETRPYRATGLLYLALVLLLTMYGGTNVLIFVSYSVAALVVVIAMILKRGVHPLETAFVLVAMASFHKLFRRFPLPSEDFDAYVDFYGGWSSRVNAATAARFVEIVVFVLCAVLIRALIRLRERRLPAS